MKMVKQIKKKWNNTKISCSRHFFSKNGSIAHYRNLKLGVVSGNETEAIKAAYNLLFLTVRLTKAYVADRQYELFVGMLYQMGLAVGNIGHSSKYIGKLRRYTSNKIDKENSKYFNTIMPATGQPHPISTTCDDCTIKTREFEALCTKYWNVERGWFQCDVSHIYELTKMGEGKAAVKIAKRDYYFFTILSWTLLQIQQRYVGQSGDGKVFIDGIPNGVGNRYKLGNLHQKAPDPCHQFQTVYSWAFNNNLLQWIHIITNFFFA
eukprot:500516_1